MLQNRAVLAVAAFEIPDLSVFQKPDSLGELVDKIPVMGHKQQHALKFLDGSFDPFPGGNVQVVCWLVQNQKIDLLIHQHAQPQSGLFAAGEVSYTLEYILTLEQERSQPVTGHLRRTVLFVKHGIVETSLRVVKMNDLRQIPPFDCGAKADFSGAVLLTEKALDKGGLAGAVIAQKSDSLSALNYKLHI